MFFPWDPASVPVLLVPVLPLGDHRLFAKATLGAVGQHRFNTNLGATQHTAESHIPSGKHTKNYGKSALSMGKSTISMAMFNSKLLVYQRLYPFQ